MESGYDTPSGTDPLSGSFTTLPDDAWWTVEVDPDSSLYTPDDVYIYSKDGMDRFSPDGTHRWHVDTDDKPDDEPSSVISGGSTLYHRFGSRWHHSLMARDVETGDELWTYDTSVHMMSASESAVFVGSTFDDGGGIVLTIDAESGEKRWENTLWPQSSAVFTTARCLVPTYTMDQSERKSTLSALDVTSGERLWHYTHEDDHEALQVVGDTAYQLTGSTVAAYELPGGEEYWNQSLEPEQ